MLNNATYQTIDWRWSLMKINGWVEDNDNLEKLDFRKNEFNIPSLSFSMLKSF
jgi:hypothetical protein